LHNSEKDVSTVFSSDEWKMKKEMQPNELYYLTYKVTTMNGLECSSARYLILNQEYVDAYIPFDLQATLDFDDACIKLDLNSTNKIPVVINGNYILTRSSSLDNYTTWDEIHRFAYNNFKVEDKTTYSLWEDFAIQ
jgi:hypothetical protein